MFKGRLLARAFEQSTSEYQSKSTDSSTFRMHIKFFFEEVFSTLLFRGVSKSVAKKGSHVSSENLEANIH